MMTRFWKILIPALLLLGAAVLLLVIMGPMFRTPQERLEACALEYIELAMALDRAYPGEVDIYFGPAALDTRDGDDVPLLADLQAQADELYVALQDTSLAVQEDRRAALADKVSAYSAVLANLLEPSATSFTEEARLLFGISLGDAAPPNLSSYRTELEALLPGSGGLAYRLAQFRNQFLIPADKREAVFTRALEECRVRTGAHWQMPASESLRLEWSREVEGPWHGYEGEGQSVLRMNPLSVAYFASAVDVACHESYPGHHAQYVFLEQQWRDGTAYPEDTLTLLRSPESSLREAAAMVAVDLVFPLQERIDFETEVLAPLAGFSSLDIAKYNRVRVLLDGISQATVPILRDYSDLVTPPASATFRLERDALVSSPNQLLAFSDRYGAYAAAYTLGKIRVAEYIDAQAGETASDPWVVLRQLIEKNEVEALNFTMP